MTNKDATARPWYSDKLGDIYDADDNPVATTDRMKASDLANAALIVEAVNNHDRLRSIEELAGEMAEVLKDIRFRRYGTGPSNVPDAKQIDDVTEKFDALNTEEQNNG